MASLLASPAARASDSIDAAPFAGKKIRIDGMLRGWPKLQELNQTLRGKSGRDPAAMGLVGYDDKYLYVAMDVTDKKLVRTRGFGTGEDFATLTLAFPRPGGGYRTYSVHFYPGVPGKSAGVVKFRDGGKIGGSSIVEASSDGGLTFEAKVPWGAFAEAARVRIGLRAALSYSDADRGGRIGTVIATSKATSGGMLPPLNLEGEYALKHALLFSKGLKERPDKELVGNVAGSRLAEKVSIYDRYLTIVGPGYRNGSEFYYQDLSVERAKDVTLLKLMDLTGDGRDDVVLRKRVGERERYREVLQIWSVKAGSEEPQLVFQHELAIVQPDIKLINSVKFDKFEGKRSIVVGQDTAKLNPDEFSEPVAGDMHPVLLPWEAVQQKVYQWSGDEFEVVDEKIGEPKMTRGKKRRRRAAEGDPLPSSGGTEPPPRPRPPSADEMLDQVYSLYRKERGLKKSTPRFDFVTDVAGDDNTERVLVHDRDIVAFGKKFLDGTSYVYTTLGFKDTGDILDVTARDMTGDGKAEVIVRGVIEAKASKKLGGDVVRRHALFVYKIRSSGVKRIFAAETGRSLEDKAVLGKLVFAPKSGGVTIDLRPGRAVGWSQDDYPFPEDRFPYSGLEPLLLPWTELEPRHYEFDGSKYVER